jgi:hypothetical protein
MAVVAAPLHFLVNPRKNHIIFHLPKFAIDGYNGKRNIVNKQQGG